MNTIITRIENMIRKVHCVGKNPPKDPVSRGEIWELLKDTMFRIESLEDNIKKRGALVDGIIERAIEQLSNHKDEIRDFIGAVPKDTTLLEDLEFMDTIPDD